MIEQTMMKRYSCRKFDERKIDDELVKEIVNLTRLSPSSCGLEPWLFMVVKGEKLNELGEICNNQEQVKCCSHAVIVISRNDLKADSEYMKFMVAKRANTPEKWEKAMKYFHAKFDDLSAAQISNYASKQCYMASANLVNIAYEKGVKSCIIAGFDAARLKEFIALDERFEPVLVIALGFGEENERQKVRNDLEKVMIWRA